IGCRRVTLKIARCTGTSRQRQETGQCERNGHCLFLGKAGSGMSVTKQQMRVFLAKSDVSRIKALYSGEDGERLAEAIRHNCSVWFPLNPGGKGNDA
ncbi:hypothetical protein ACSLN9_03925, partial [Enterobacter kobei]